MDLYNFGAVMSTAFHKPQGLSAVDPARKQVESLENVHPMLRPVRH